MLEELVPLSIVLGGKLVGIGIDVNEKRNAIFSRRLYMSRYGRITIQETKEMTLHELHRSLKALGEIIEKENMVSSLSER